MSEFDVVEDLLQKRQHTVVEFITRFPRLQYIRITSMFQLEEFVQVVDKLPYLTKIDMISSDVDNSRDFMERYMAMKESEDEKDQLIKRLSEFENFSFRCRNRDVPIPIGSVQFIRNYLKGLKRVTIEWDSGLNKISQEQIQCLLDIVCPAKDKTSTHEKNLDALESDFQFGVESFFMEMAFVGRSLSLNITKPNVNVDYTFSFVTRSDQSEESEQKTVISARSQGSIYRSAFERIVNTGDPDFLLIYFQSEIPVEDLTKVTDMCNRIIEHMPSVKELEVNLPLGSNGVRHPQIRTLRFNTSYDELTESSLSQFQHFNVFPNLTCLNLFYFGGVYSEFNDIYQVNLSAYNLEKVAIDLTYVGYDGIIAIDNELRKIPLKEAYGVIGGRIFLIDVTCQDSHKRYLYKVSFDLSKITKMNDLSTKAVHGEVRVRVFVGDLKALQVCVYNKDSGSVDDYINDFRPYTKKINLELGI